MARYDKVEPLKHSLLSVLFRFSRCRDALSCDVTYMKALLVTDFSAIPAPLARALETRGFKNLTPVQLACSDPELGNQDLLVSAQTGSGKTVAFGIAIAPMLLAGADQFDRAGAPTTLVIAPTRELALQVMRELEWLYKETGARIASCVGGMDYRTEKRTLERGAHIVVGTPGRLRDHIQRNSLDLSELRAAILDEADEMLDLGFKDDLEFILESAPAERRTLMFSATVSNPIAKLAKSYQNDARRLTVKSEEKQHADIEYRALVTTPRDKDNAIVNTLRFYEARNAIVFCATRATVNHLTSRLSNRGFQVVALSGELSQAERSNALQAMRDGRARVCVATDVAARGIDLPGLELVIHADLPQNQEALLHRSGRTGRAGSKGVSALIVPQTQRKKAERILGWAKVNADWAKPPSASEVAAKDNWRLIEALKTEEQTPAADNEKEVVEELKSLLDHDAMALAYLRLSRGKQSAPEEIEAINVDAPAKRERRDEFAESVWMSLSVGRNDRAEPRWILPLVCRCGDITKADIGAIKLQQDETFVQLNATVADKFFNNLKDGVLEDNVKATRLDRAPKIAAGKGGSNYPNKPGRGGPRKDYGDKPRGPRKDFGDKPRGPKKEWDDKPRGPKKDYGDKPRGPKKEWGDKPKRDYDDKPKRDYGDKPKSATRYDDRGPKPRTNTDAISKPRHKSAPSSDFKPKFGGKADAMPSRGGKPGGKPSGKPAGKGPNKWADPSAGRKPRTKKK